MERALLRRAAAEPLEIGALDGGERATAAALADRGFVALRDARYPVNGEAWQAFLRAAGPPAG